MTNPYCDALGIQVPSLEAVKEHREASTYARLLVALLERGAPMTLLEVAEAFEDAGIAAAQDSLRSLKRCRPARPPVYRDGDVYALDPHDDELDFWAFRLGLRPPKVPRLSVVRPAPEPLPGSDVPLSAGELEQAFRGAWLVSWSAQRVALAILDAHQRPMEPAAVVECADRLCQAHPLRVDAAEHWGRGAIRVDDRGIWSTDPEHPWLRSAREAVRKRIESARRWERATSDPAVVAANRRFIENKRAAHAEELAKLRRALVHAFPRTAPQALVIVDVATRSLTTLVGADLETAAAVLADYDLIGAIDVRHVLRELGFDPGTRRLAELGPPQKSIRINKRGRTLKITSELLVRGSCRISRPFGDAKKLRQYLKDDQSKRLRRRLEADAKSLYALYAYGRLHGAVRLAWGFLDEMIPAPWRHRDEPVFYTLKRQVYEQDAMLELVIGSAPGWAAPWARGQRCAVVPDGSGHRFVAVGTDGYVVHDRDVQLARVIED